MPARLRVCPQEILRPFLLVCESRNPRLVGSVLGSLQKLLAHGAVSSEGRAAVIAALQQVERNPDETVRLKMLQTALTLLQDSDHADDQVLHHSVLHLSVESLFICYSNHNHMLQLSLYKMHETRTPRIDAYLHT
jgi:Dimerisation and cyclophilin-binding domain of Mon2